MPSIDIAKEAVDSFSTGAGVAGTSPVQLPGALVRKQVVVRADSGNGNVVIVGTGAETVANGFALAAGEQSPPIFVDDLAKIWLVGGAASQAYSWVAS